MATTRSLLRRLAGLGAASALLLPIAAESQEAPIKLGVLYSLSGTMAISELTEGIQPSIVKQIGAVIRMLAARGEMAIVLVEQYLDFARDVAERLVVMERGAVVVTGAGSAVDDADVRRYLTV